MKTIEKEKDFDCIKIKNEIQALIYAEIKDMDSARLLAYFNQSVAAYVAFRPKNVNGVIDADSNQSLFCH